MAYSTSEEIYVITGSNLQICFVNEHHQANESSDNDSVRRFFKNHKIQTSIFVEDFKNKIKKFQIRRN